MNQFLQVLTTVNPLADPKDWLTIAHATGRKKEVQAYSTFINTYGSPQSLLGNKAKQIMMFAAYCALGDIYEPSTQTVLSVDFDKAEKAGCEGAVKICKQRLKAVLNDKPTQYPIMSLRGDVYGAVTSTSKTICTLLSTGRFFPMFVFEDSFKQCLKSELQKLIPEGSCVVIGDLAVVPEAYSHLKGYNPDGLTMCNIRSKAVFPVSIDENTKYVEFLSKLFGGSVSIDRSEDIFPKDRVVGANTQVVDGMLVDKDSAALQSIQEALFYAAPKTKCPVDKYVFQPPVRAVPNTKGINEFLSACEEGPVIVAIPDEKGTINANRYTSNVEYLKGLDAKGALVLSKSLDDVIAEYTKYYSGKGLPFICKVAQESNQMDREYTAYKLVKFKPDVGDFAKLSADYDKYRDNWRSEETLVRDMLEIVRELEKAESSKDPLVLKVTYPPYTGIDKVQYITTQDVATKYYSSVAETVSSKSVKAVVNTYIDSIAAYKKAEANLDTLTLRAYGLNRPVYRLVPYSVIKFKHFPEFKYVPLKVVPTNRALLNESGLLVRLANYASQNAKTVEDCVVFFKQPVLSLPQGATAKALYIRRFLEERTLEELEAYAAHIGMTDILEDAEDTGYGASTIAKVLTEKDAKGFGNYDYAYMRGLLQSGKVAMLTVGAGGGAKFVIGTKNLETAVKFYGARNYADRLANSAPKKLTAAWINRLGASLRFFLNYKDGANLKSACEILGFPLVANEAELKAELDKLRAALDESEASKLQSPGNETTISFTVLDKAGANLISSVVLKNIVKAVKC